TAPSSTGASRCGTGLVPLMASGCTGGTLKWYDAASAETQVNKGTSFPTRRSAKMTFYVSCTSAAGCEGPRTPVTGTINDIPAAPSATGASGCGTGVLTLRALGCTGGTLKWYDAAIAGTQVNTGTSYAANLSASTTL